MSTETIETPRASVEEPCTVKGKEHLVQKRYYSDARRLPFKSLVIRELDGNDTRTVDQTAQAHIGSANKDPMAVLNLQQREAYRASIVAVDDVYVGTPGLMMVEVEKWSQRAFRFLQTAYYDLNGVEDDELKKFLGAK